MADFGAQDTSKALDILAFGTVAADDNRDAAVRHVNALIEHTACNQFGVLASAKAFQNRAPFLCGSFIGDAGQAKATADLINDLVIFREQNYLVTGMHVKKAFNFDVFGRSIHSDVARLAPGEHGFTRFGIAGAEEDDLLLKLFRGTYHDAPAL